MAMIRKKLQFEGPFGLLTVEGTEEKLYRIYFDHSRLRVDETNALLRETRKQIGEYFRGKRQRFDLPYELEGTEFQKQVWREMARVPYGKLRTYGEIAQIIGRPKAMRAVGGAMGKNPLPLLLPCHRVVARGRRLGGFTGGCHIKEYLLRLERSDRFIRGHSVFPALA